MHVTRTRAPGTRHSRRDERGAAAVEFALVTIPLLLLVFGIIQYGVYFYSVQTGSSVSREALRRVSVGDCQDATQLKTYVQNHLGAASAGSLTVTRTYMDTADAPSMTPVVGGTVKLVVTYKTLNLHLPFVPFLNKDTITRTTQARMEDDQSEVACT